MAAESIPGLVNCLGNYTKWSSNKICLALPTCKQGFEFNFYVMCISQQKILSCISQLAYVIFFLLLFKEQKRKEQLEYTENLFVPKPEFLRFKLCGLRK